MPNAMETANTWIATKGDAAIGALTGALDLYQKLTPQAAVAQQPVTALFVGDAVADRAIADAAGVAAIAGQHGVSITDVLEAVGILKDVALAVTAFA